MLRYPFVKFLIYLWPLVLVFGLGQGMMRLTGNTETLGISPLLSTIDMVVFLLFFGSAAWLASRPLCHALGEHDAAQTMEPIMASFPWRTLKMFVIAGIAYALYLMLAISLSAVASGYHLSLNLLLSLMLNFTFGAAVLAPSLAVAQCIVFSVKLRLQLSTQGLFLGYLDQNHSYRQFTSSSFRPWLVFVVTGLLPTLILSTYVFLSFKSDAGNSHFILMQALVLVSMSIAASVLLVLTISYTFKRVTLEMESGLKRLANGQFDARVTVLLDDEFGDLALGLNTAMRGLREREDLKDALAVAAEIQQGLLPKFAPVIPYYQLQGFQQTCYAVGGDYYDYIELDDGRVWLMIADVSGKGYPAALTMANLQAMLRGLATLNWPIEEAANYLNNALCDTLAAGRFVTLFMAKLQPESHSLVWINAGHVPPLLCRSDNQERLPASAPPLGLVKGMNYEVARTEFLPGDTLFCYTDGVTESSSHQAHQRFGEDRLKIWLEQHCAMDLKAMPAALLTHLEQYGRSDQDDDLTLLCVRRNN